MHWFVVFLSFILISSGIHWINFGQFTKFLGLQRFQPALEKSNTEVYGMQFWLSILKTTTIVLTFYALSDWIPKKLDNYDSHIETFRSLGNPIFNQASQGNFINLYFILDKLPIIINYLGFQNFLI